MTLKLKEMNRLKCQYRTILNIHILKSIPPLRKSLVYFLELISFTSCFTHKKNTKPDAGNPVFDGWYADLEGIIFGDQFWISPTYSAPYDEQVFLDAFSSEDLVNWTKYERILDTSSVKWVTCIDLLEFDEKGRIKQVTITTNGVKRNPLN